MPQPYVLAWPTLLSTVWGNCPLMNGCKTSIFQHMHVCVATFLQAHMEIPDIADPPFLCLKAI